MTADIRESGWTHESGEGFLALVGGYWIQETRGQFCFGFRSSNIHRNRNDIVHGGMLMTFVDRAMGQTARPVTGAMRSATITMNASFLVPMKLDEPPRVYRRVKHSKDESHDEETSHPRLSGLASRARSSAFP